MKLVSVLSSLVVGGLVIAPLPAAAQTVAAYKPAGQWALDYGDDYCRLARNFSNGNDQLAVAVERIEPGPSGRLIVISNGIHPYRTAEEIGWHFMPADAERKARYTHSTTADGKQYYNLGPFMVTPPALPTPGAKPAPPIPFDRAQEQAAAKALTGITLDNGLTAPIQIDTGDMSAPIAALQACADDLAKSWGLDPAKLQTEKSSPIPAGGGVGWLPAGTIDFADFGKLGAGSNQVRLMVDASGRATSCMIHWATLDPAANDKICKAAMASAKFTPAMDANGQPMPGYWIGSPLFMGPPMKGFGP